MGRTAIDVVENVFPDLRDVRQAGSIPKRETIDGRSNRCRTLELSCEPPAIERCRVETVLDQRVHHRRAGNWAYFDCVSVFSLDGRGEDEELRQRQRSTLKTIVADAKRALGRPRVEEHPFRSSREKGCSAIRHQFDAPRSWKCERGSALKVDHEEVVGQHTIAGV